MKRTLAVIALLLGALALAAVAALAVRNPVAAGPVYTVAQVQGGLMRHPRAWIGRTVLVRGATIGWVGTDGPGTTAMSALPCFGPCSIPPDGWSAPHLVLMQGTVSGGYPDVAGTVASSRQFTLLLHVPSSVHTAASPGPLAFLRGLPVVGPWFSSRGQPVYRVRILRGSPALTPCRLPSRACDDAVLVGVQDEP